EPVSVPIYSEEPVEDVTFEEAEVEEIPVEEKRVKENPAKEKQSGLDTQKRNIIMAIAGLSAVVVILVICLVVILSHGKKEKLEPMVAEAEAAAADENSMESSDEIISLDDSTKFANIPEAQVVFSENDANALIYHKWLTKFINGFTWIDGGTDMISYADTESKDNWYFAFKDLNGDGVSELLISSSYKQGLEYTGNDNFEYLPLMTWKYMTISDSECQQGGYGCQDVLCYDTDENRIYTAFVGENNDFDKGYIENNQYIIEDEYYDEHEYDYYLKNNNNISREEYESMLSDFAKKVKEYPFEAIPLTPENIDKYLPMSEDMRAVLYEYEEQNKALAMFRSFIKGDSKIRIGDNVSVGYYDSDYDYENSVTIYKHGGQELSLSEIKDIIVNDAGIENLYPEIYYSVLNINDNNVFLLMLKNVGTEGFTDDGSCSTFVIVRQGDDLVATYSFDMYGRGGSFTNKYGVLSGGGSAGAGDHLDDEYYIDENGNVNCIYRSETCYSGWIGGLFGWFKKDYFSQHTLDLAALYDSTEVQEQAGCEVTLYEIDGQMYGTFDSDVPGFADILRDAAINDGLKLYTGVEIDSFAESLGIDKGKREQLGENEPEWYDYYSPVGFANFYK
ncbi:MAG: hypothetical protein Q4D29_04980, partial [Lachnospiraceae bacterium]|nr:hypothetical protein [Lachnospiraceae bacterium]